MKTDMPRCAAIGIPLVAALWLACMLWSYFPGSPTADTLRQLSEGVSGCYLNWKPALYSWLLRTLEFQTPWGGVGGALVVQLCFFALAVSGIACHYARRNVWYSLLILVLPIFFTVKGMLVCVVGNDEMAAGCYLLYIAGILTAVDMRQERLFLRRGIVFASLLVLAYGLALRHNALPAVFVLACWGMWKIGVQKKWTFVSAGVGVVLVSLALNSLLTYHVLRAEASYPLRSPLVDDIVNLSILEGKWHPVVKEFHDGALELPHERCVFAPESGNWNSPMNPYALYPDVELRRRDYELLKKAWWEMVQQHPDRYLLTKAFFFHQFLLEGRVIPWLCKKFRGAYPHIRIHMEQESSSWRAWVNREFLVMSLIPLMSYLLIFACLCKKLRAKMCANPERIDALVFIFTAFCYTSSFALLVLSATEQRYYIIRASLCSVGAALFVLSFLVNRRKVENAA